MTAQLGISRSPGRSLVIVNYRSAVLTAQAIASARSASSVPLEIIVVDNSCDEGERRSLAGAGADRVIASERNVGYGVAMNRGASVATGEELLLANPDIVFGERAIDTLFQALGSGPVISGPRFVWDGKGEWQLPPADPYRRRDRLESIMASRYDRWRRDRARRRFFERVAFWRLRKPASVPSLSGAVLATSRETFWNVGGFDERFFLFFEETDLLRRLRLSGGRAIYVPAAVCRHLYAQTPSEDRQVHFSASESEYLRKWSAGWLSTLTARFARPELDPPLPPPGRGLEVPGDGRSYVAELSPLPGFETAAGLLDPSSVVEVPAEVLSTFRGEHLFLRLVDGERGETVAAVTVRKPVE